MMTSMPPGFWKSKWDIHREDMDRYREDMDRYRRDLDLDREESERRHAEYRAEMRAMRERSDEIAEETRDLRDDYDREIAEMRTFNRELLIRLEKTYANLGTILDRMGDRIEMLAEAVDGMRIEIHELKGSVDAQTDAILRLVDRFDDLQGRPPV